MAEASYRLKKCGTGDVKGKLLLMEVHTDQENVPLLNKFSVVDRAPPLVSKFSVLDLETGELSKTPFTLTGIARVPDILSVGSLIYVIGNPSLDNKIDTNTNTNNTKVQIHEGMFFFDLNKPELGWNKAPSINENQEFTLKCVSCFGKIYIFRCSKSPCFAEVYDPQFNCWNPLLDSPPICGDFKVGYPVVYDPLNACIVIHFFNSDESHSMSRIYAYYPTLGRWECLVDKFKGGFYTPMVVVDGVIYFNYRKLEEMVEAYDLTTRQWLTVVLSSKFSHSSRIEFSCLCHLGDGVLCLTTSGYKLRKIDPSVIKDHTSVLAVKFKVEVRRNDHRVIVTPLGSTSCPIEGLCRVYGYLPI